MNGKVVVAAALLLLGLNAAAGTEKGVSAEIAVNAHITVDQFGYLTNAVKVAVIRDPQVGFDRADRFAPGGSYQVRRAQTGEAVLTGSPKPWNRGETQESSGDRGWWFDFSSVTAADRYFIFDVANNVRSPAFNVGPNVYKDVLKAAVRMFYYQRSSFPKLTPHADACWVDDAAYIGKDQDRQARDVTDRNNLAKVKDVSGGWFDAGDTDKYVTFATQPVHQLLTAYATNKAAFTDDFNIPESGNGVPDILDEVKWEIEWLKKMQYSDGSFALKVGNIENALASPPSSDKSPRFYVPSCTSATIASSGMLAHAALVFADFPQLAAEARDLERRAAYGWRNYQKTPKQTNCDSGAVRTANADLNADEQNALAVEAAVYLFALTGDEEYDDYVIKHYKETQPYHDSGWTRYKPDQGEALLFYTSLAKANGGLRRTLVDDKISDIRAGKQIYGFAANDDLYRAFLHDGQYHWGSSNPRANYGNTNLDVVFHDLGIRDTSTYRMRALETLHYFHGVNPFGMVYLSNMYALGATSSANEIFHLWFQRNSKWSNAKSSPCGPAPGFVSGGPNASAAKNGVPATLMPPVGQPPQKSYKDWNAAWPDSSWAVTEPGIYYQSAYVRLLSVFVQ